MFLDATTIICTLSILLADTSAVRNEDFIKEEVCSHDQLEEKRWMATPDGAKADGCSNSKYIEFDANCKEKKILKCTAANSLGKKIAVSAVASPVYRGEGCSAEYIANDNDRIRKCVLCCASGSRPIATCEGFVKDEICTKKAKDGRTIDEQTASFDPGLLGLQYRYKALPEKRITYTADCNTNEIKTCSIVEDMKDEPISVTAAHNPQPDTSGCTSSDFVLKAVKVVKTSKDLVTPLKCRMCCSKYGKAFLTCE